MNQENPPNPEEPAEHPPAVVPEAAAPAVVPEPVPPAIPAPSVAAVPSIPGGTLASPSAVPVRPGAAAAGGSVTGSAYPLPRRNANIRGLALLGLLVVGAWLLFFRPHANHNEQLANEVTVAIENNNMLPVEKYFTAGNRPELENKIRVARLSEDVSALGKLQSVKEDTAKDAPAGRHHFTETFEKGSRVVDMTIDDDGKIFSFNIHSPSTSQP
jgi:hypothetical protein